jgi:UDP-N-acetylmuramoylalanine--D-glutamate ligase
MSFSKIFKLDNKKILNTVNNFKGLNFRQQIILNNDDVIIINDSKSTNFSSSINLLKSYTNIFWLVGGIPKKGDVFALPKKYYKNIKVYIYGNNIIFFKKLFTKKLCHQSFKNLEDAVKKICFDINKENDRKICVLFSPAAASFDQFKNFEDRGKYFNKLIKKIKLKI